MDRCVRTDLYRQLLFSQCLPVFPGKVLRSFPIVSEFLSLILSLVQNVFRIKLGIADRFHKHPFMIVTKTALCLNQNNLFQQMFEASSR